MLDDRYRVTRLVARGGMAEVYEAEQMSLGRHVAIKVLRPDKEDHDSSRAARLEQEARLMTRLDHPHIVKLHDVGRLSSGGTYLAMQLLSGQPLDVVIEGEGPLCPRRVWTFACQVLSALAQAHAAGVIHRDLKPENIIVGRRASDEEHLTVLDFGIAKSSWAGADPSLTRTGCFVGSPRYTSPEQALGQELSARTDLYGFGLLVYEMLTGHGPFQLDAPVDLVMAHVERPAPAPVVDGVRLSGPLVDLMMACLAKDPQRRPPSARAALKLLLAAGPPIKRREGRSVRRRTPTQRAAATVPPPLPSPRGGPPKRGGSARKISKPDAAPTTTSKTGASVRELAPTVVVADLMVSPTSKSRLPSGPDARRAPRRTRTARVPRAAPARRSSYLLAAAIGTWLLIVGTAAVLSTGWL